MIANHQVRLSAHSKVDCEVFFLHSRGVSSPPPFLHLAPFPIHGKISGRDGPFVSPVPLGDLARWWAAQADTAWPLRRGGGVVVGADAT